ncbi:MAG: dephospho-CoA kinase [Kiloniellales bacterium]
MVILGLTGSIGMGKSTAAAALRRLGVPVHDADAVVHDLLAQEGAAARAITAVFPGVLRDGRIDRRKLGDRVFGDPAALAALEAILHPLVRRRTMAFLKRQARARRQLVVLDIPLLFETGGDSLCDAVILVSAPKRIQRARVLRRPGMTPEKFAAICAQQLPDAEKRRRADFVVPTGLGRSESLRRLAAIVRLMRQRPGRHWPPCARQTRHRHRRPYSL